MHAAWQVADSHSSSALLAAAAGQQVREQLQKADAASCRDCPVTGLTGLLAVPAQARGRPAERYGVPGRTGNPA